MGVGLSTRPKTFDNTKFKEGKKPSLKDPVVVHVSSEGFNPGDITVFSGQVIRWEWESDDPEVLHNIKQVTLSDSGQAPVPVPHGLCSGQLCPTGTFEVEIVACGSYYFISEGHSSLNNTTIKVLAAPQETIKVTDEKFEPDFVEINEGESVTWRWESGKRNQLKKVEFCLKHCGITFSNLNPTCDPDNRNTYTYTESFENPGLYYFTGNTNEQFCIIKVLQKPREYSIRFLENRAEPLFMNGFVGDRIWVQQAKKNYGNPLMMVKSEDGGVLVSSRPRRSTKPDRRPSLISYCFTFPGIYRVLSTDGLSTTQCIILVQSKPHDYVIKTGPRGFEPELGSVKQGDRIWWMWTGEESDNRGFLIEEEERIANVRKDLLDTDEAACECFKSNDHLSSIGSFGLLSMTADTPGLFTYRVKAMGDWCPERVVCSIIVQNLPKNHVVCVSDHGFQPQIVNVHPGESVTWSWRDTNNSHNIQQVSHERVSIDDGFHSNFLSPSPDASNHVFTDLGVFYFTSANLSAVYGAVVVTAGNQVHKVDVTLRGVEPDPLGVRVGDIVCWRWSNDLLCSINAIKSPDEIDKIVQTQDVPIQRRCVAATFKTTGIHHFASTAYLGDEDQPEIHACGSFINTIYVDPAPYTCRVKVSRDGFQPPMVTLAKHKSVLWSWDNIPDEQHNIVLIENHSNQTRLVPVRGAAFFESGPLTSRSSFFHTFDTPGSHWVTSHGTDGKRCRIDVLDEAKFVMPPEIANGSDGGNVELGYTVFLSCADRDVEILFTLDGSIPAVNLPNTNAYDWQKGIRLSHPGLYLIRAISIKTGWIPSEIFTTRRFWVLDEEEGDDVLEESSMDDNLGLRQEITNWQWSACAPAISSSLVFDNNIRIDFTLSPNAQVAWIAGFQLYINGQPYGGWLCASCPGIEVSGLTGGKVYHVVIVVFPAHEEFSPQLSNELIIQCPTVSTFGGPIISLETCDRVDAPVIVWPANQGCSYILLVDGQPMGEQVSAEPDNDYCQVLFETENVEEERTLTVMIVVGEDQQLVSNEIQFSLPLPIEMIQPTGSKSTEKEQEISTPEEQDKSTLEDINPATSPTNVSREVLMISELSVATILSRTEGEGSPTSPQFQSTLDTIHEDKQLDVSRSSSPRPSLQCVDEIISEESREQLDANNQDINNKSSQEKGYGDIDTHSAVNVTASIEESVGDNNFDEVQAEGDISKEHWVLKQDQADNNNEEKFDVEGDRTSYVDGNISLKSDVDGTNFNKDLPLEEETTPGSLREQENRSTESTLEKYVKNNEEPETAEATKQREIQNTIVTDDNIYGPLDLLSNGDPLKWEYVISSHCDFNVDSIDEDANEANRCLVGFKKATTETVSYNFSDNRSFSNSGKSDGLSSLLEARVEELVFNTCEKYYIIREELLWCEYYGTIKYIEMLEKTLCIMENSIDFVTEEEITQSVDDSIIPIVRELQIIHSTLCVEYSDVRSSDKDISKPGYSDRDTSLPIPSENNESVLSTRQASELTNKDVEEEVNKEDCAKDKSPFVFGTQLTPDMTPDLTLAVKGTSPSSVVLEWEDKSSVVSPVYYVMVFGETFGTDIDSHYRYSLKNSPTPDMWPDNRTTIEQHCWTTERSIIEIRGLRQRHRYRIAVIILPRDSNAIPTNTLRDGVSSRDGITTSLRSDMLSFMMPGRPKAPVIYVTVLRNREFTISWRPSCSYGDATVVGYRLQINGKQHGELLPHDAIQHTVSDLQYGTFQHVNLVAVTNHHVGDSTQSNVATIACPNPSPPPKISLTTTTSPRSICITWSAVTTAVDPDERKLLSSYDVFVDDVFHGSCPAGDVTDIFMDSFTYTIPGCIAGREYSVKVKGHVDPREIESSQPAHMCGCYGEPSNTLLVRCLEAPCAPVLRVESMDESAVNLSWDKPQVYGSRNITGYILRVNGCNHGDVHTDNTQTAKLTSLLLGNDCDVTISALTNNITDAPQDSRRQEQRDLRLANEAHVHEPHDSGVESSSSVFVDKRSEATLQSAPLTLHLWGFVKRVRDVQIKQVCCCSALVQWSLQEAEERSQEQHHDVSINPEIFKVKCWKSEELSAQKLEPIETSNMDIHLSNLTPLSRYGLVIEAFAHHPNYSESNGDWNISRTDKIWFDTKPPLNPLQNIRVVSRTLSSICLAWDLPSNDDGSPFKQIELSVYKKYDNENVTSCDGLIHLVINPHMTSYTIHNLDPKTAYLFDLKTSYKNTGSSNERQCCGKAVSLEACTSGIDRPHDLRVIKRTPFSLNIAWERAVPYGGLEVLHYLSHYTEKKTRSSQGVASALKDGNFIRIPHSSVLGPQTEIPDLEPGVVYNIVVEAVVGLRDKDVEEGEEEDQRVNDGDEVASSISSSESDWLSSVFHDCLSKSLTASTTAPPGIPGLFVTGITATQIHLAWNIPVSLYLESEDQERAQHQELRGRVRQISGYSLEVNGRVVTKLSPISQNFTLKRCKPGMKYTCYLVVMTTASDSGGKRSKKTEGFHNKEIPAVSNTDLESDDETDTSIQEARSEPLEVTIPRQDYPLVVNIQYSPTSVSQVSSVSSSGSEDTDEGCVAIEWKASTALKGVTSYEVKWRNTPDEASEYNDSLLSSCNSYEIYPVKQRSVYSVWLKMLRKDNSSMSWGPLNCQVPGRPDPPWIWCRSVSSHRILVEWNEPKLYGVDTIRAYQVNLNGRQLGKLLSPQNRKVAVHCQPNSVYRIVLLALTTDPNLGGSDPSNLLTICTPGMKDKSLDPKQNIRIKPLWAENDSITVEWSDDNDLLTVDHYVIKWSSVLHPQSTERTIPMHQVSYTIEDCKPGTRHFIAVAAVDERGKLVSKSPQLTVQTSAPLAAPKLRLSSSLPSCIQVEWDRPIPVGDATVHSYEIKVNDVIRTTLDNSHLSFQWENCPPCTTYDFQIKVISMKEDCHSNWSEILSCTCPGAYVPVITRAPSNHINSIHVTWDPPNLVGGASVKSYKVHYLADEEKDLTNDFIVNNPSIITHEPLQDSTHEDTLDNALPTLPYWVVLEVDLLPEGCITVFSQPIRTQVAVPPDPPLISVFVVGLEERRALERFVCGLVQIKDRICRKLQLLQNSVVLKGSKQKEAQISKNLATIRNLEVELNNCTLDIQNLTGLLNANIKWTVPHDDSDATVTGYQVLIDGTEHEAPLDKYIISSSLELPASSHDHLITVKALTNHPIGHSAPSNAVIVHAKDFLPFVQFCYFEVHSESAVCCYGDNLSHEVRNKLISTHRGCFGKPLPPPVCNVTDVANQFSIKPLVTSSEIPQAILFWTNWCHSSIKAMEMFIQFSRGYSHELGFTTCCIKSGNPDSGHHQSLHDLLRSRGWISEVTNVRHTCGCHADNQRPSFQRSVGRGQKSGLSHVFGLVGVPTIVLCNKEGYMIWQGRCSTQLYSEYQQLMCHALSEASNQSCSVPNCTQCSLDHELNTMDTNCYSSQMENDHPSDCFKYVRAKCDSSLEVTGRLSKFRKKKLSSLDHNQSTDQTGLTGLVRQDGKLLNEETSYENVHPSVMEETEKLHRRLHGIHPQYSPQTTPLQPTPLQPTPPQPTPPQSAHPRTTRPRTTHQTTQSTPTQCTRPQTTQATSRNHMKTSLHTNSSRNPKTVRISTPVRAKSAYGTRKSVFKDRFSPSVISTLPSLGMSLERAQPKERHRSATSKPKQKISVDEFSPI